jgi:hypothetical protein
LLAGLLLFTGEIGPVAAQDGDTGELIETVVPDDLEGELDVPEQVDVQPTARG